MRLFFKRFLAVFSALFGFSLAALGLIGFLVPLCDRKGFHGLGDTLACFFFMGFCPGMLGVGLIRFARDEWGGQSPGQKVTARLLLRIALRGLGVLAILVGLALAVIAFTRVKPEDGAAARVFLLGLGTFLPLALGYGLIADAETHHDPDSTVSELAHDRALIYRLGRAILIVSLCLLTFAMPLGGRVALLVFALCVFAAEAWVRSRPKYQGKTVLSPVGKMDAAEAEVIGDIAEGTAYLAFRLTIEIIFAVLTGGKSGFSGGGGSSGGGGASGKF